MAFRILVVDDEEAIRVMLQHFLASLSYEVETAADGIEALDKLGRSMFDLVLSDINMPRMKGFQLLQEVRQRYPAVKRVLITAYDVDDYLRLALRHDIGNIIPKTTPFSFVEIETVLRNLLKEDFFGLDRYLLPGTQKHAATITRHEQIEETTEKIASHMENEKKSRKLILVLNEILTNAVYYGGRGEQGTDKTTWVTEFELPPQLAIEAVWGIDSEKFGFAVTDNAGRLRKKDVLHWLCRQTEKDVHGVPKGVFDLHGRGFFIARNYVDSLIVNIRSAQRTEVIGLTYFTMDIQRHKPLYINEI
jgi:CheY-like chemotaxis protein